MRWWCVGLLVSIAAIGPLTSCSDDGDANDLGVGDCTNDDLTGEVADVETVDCDESHVAEVYAVFDLEGRDFPGDAETASQAEDGCNGPRFEDYVGIPYNQSTLYTTFLTPTEESWNDADDRTVICFAVTEDRSPTTGSVEGADR